MCLPWDKINSSSAESQNADITGEFRSLFQLLQSAGFPTESCEHIPKACYREMTREWEQHCESGNHSQKRKKWVLSSGGSRISPIRGRQLSRGGANIWICFNFLHSHAVGMLKHTLTPLFVPICTCSHPPMPLCSEVVGDTKIMFLKGRWQWVPTHALVFTCTCSPPCACSCPLAILHPLIPTHLNLLAPESPGETFTT